MTPASPSATAAPPGISFTARVLVTIALVALALLVWHLRDVVLLLFGGVVLTTVLGALAGRVCRYTGVSHRAAVAISVMLLAFVPFFGPIASGLLAVLLAFAEALRCTWQPSCC